ncbi:HAMP domain-containing sensor histidine kinase [Yoonia sp. 208BN28-4]|uniref:HAMP domain-containing sensor histidine kinase n=1 Tax=Yoonia sp. 208BN28-4 TaxID=3126505 RepID=UPI0030B79EA9
MKTSLGLRLMMAASVTTALALVATAFVLNFLFRLYFEDLARDELETYLLLLSGNVGIGATGEVEITPLSDPRFDQALSGYYWQVQIDDLEPSLSPSSWAAPLDLDRPDEFGRMIFQDAEMGSGEAAAVASWIVTIGEDEARREVFLAVAIDRADLDGPVSGFFLNSALWLAVLGVLLLVGSWIQVRLGLKPLENLRSEVNRVSTSASDRLLEKYPSEVMPLVNEVNQLLDTNAATIERVRSGAGNLAHGLKTPLTIMHGLERKIRRVGQGDLATDLSTEIANMEHIVERELARSRDSHQATKRSEIAPVAARLGRVLGHQPGFEHINWSIDVPDAMHAPFDAFELTEVLGNLLDNAMKWAEGRIVVRASEVDTTAYLIVEDDGPGLSTTAQRVALHRGGRLDDAKPGSGLGLSIVNEMAIGHDCTFTLSRSSLGGLEAKLTWHPVAV